MLMRKLRLACDRNVAAMSIYRVDVVYNLLVLWMDDVAATPKARFKNTALWS
jgi:hypothetical protein